jgi:hypothetical protein
MPQETNLNVSPYFDDFDPQNKYYKVLFKPGLPVQARELTTLQSILQNQIEQFGNHIFKEGSVVIPGQINYNNQFFAVEVEKEYLGIPVSNYANLLSGFTIRGQKSNVKAKVVFNIGEEVSQKNSHTFYITYLGAGSSGQNVFDNQETLLLDEDLTSSTFSFKTGDPFALTLPVDATSIGSAVILSAGVYFIRGTFVNVESQTLILDAHSNTPSYKVGLQIVEEIITSASDKSLTDNAKGFNNYAAPGADRLKITCVLSKKELDSPKNENFIELLTVLAGETRHIKENSEYSVLAQELARRTYDQSGDFYVSPFTITPKESLNDKKGNQGVFSEYQLTYAKNVPAEDLGVYQISAGKAFVRGFEVDLKSSTFMDFSKTRETKTLVDQGINYITGPSLSLNRAFGTPRIGFTTTSIISLRNSRIGTSSSIAGDKEIGVARIYDYSLSSGSYSASNANLNEWDIALFDIQTYTEITLNEPVTLTVPTYIQGKSSGAVAHLRYDTTSGIITAYNTKGSFSVGERLIFNGIENSRVSTAATNYGIDDVKSIYSLVGTGITFNADTKLKTKQSIGLVNVSGKSGTSPGISTVTSNDAIFSNITKVGDVVSFTNTLLSNPSVKTYAKVINVSTNTLTITGVTTVTGICDGGLPVSNINPSDFQIISAKLQSSSDNTLYTPLPKKWISSVDLTDSNLTIKKEFNVTINSGATNVVSADSNETFLPFTEQRYILVNSSGFLEPLTSDKFIYTSGNSQLQIIGLSGSGPARLIATLSKNKIKNKIKNKVRINTLIVDKSKYSQSGIGSTTLNDGLMYGNYGYGMRVQDNELCLMIPDVTKVYGVFESINTNDPSASSISLLNLNGPSGKVDDLVIGEEFEGVESEAIGIVVRKIDNLSLEFVYLNQATFKLNEKITFKESKITANIQTFTTGDSNNIANYILDSGQRETICDYSRLIRKPNIQEPTKKIKIIYESADYLPSDDGDITTVGSYGQFNYCDLPQAKENIKVTDILDIRPRVARFSPSTTGASPFDFSSRSFNNNGNSSKNILASDEDIVFSYSFYLPRIDKIYLSPDKSFQLLKGIASENPQQPIALDNALEVATINLPPYLCSTKNIDVTITQHKRYTMADISVLENRIKNLEYYTALSLLESNTENLHVPDTNGINRFKSGIFVDNFTNTSSQLKTTIVKNSIDPKNTELRPSPFVTQVDLLLGSESIIGIGTSANPSADLRVANDLIGNKNIRKSGQLLTLDYLNIIQIKQPFATRIENVTPYLVTSYIGTIDLFPTSDVWIDQVKLEPRKIEIDDYTETKKQLQASGYDPQTGLSPVMWGGWDITWAGSTSTSSQTTQLVGSRNEFNGSEVVTYNTYENVEVITSTRTGSQTRSGNQLKLSEFVDTINEGGNIVSTSVIPYIRSRNVEFTGKRFKPLTRVYGFFDGVDVNKFIIPKLIEIEMISGTFVAGELITGLMSDGSQTADSSNVSSAKISFRIAKQNHKYGDILNPSDVYSSSPYNESYTIPETYSNSSILLNVDTYSLSNQPQGLYNGYVQIGMKLRGSSGEAVVKDVKLVTDKVGTVIGSFFIPDPNIKTNPAFETGIKTFKLTSSSVNSAIGGYTDTSSEEQYFAQGTINNAQETIRSTRKPRFESIVRSETETVTDVQVTNSVTNETQVTRTFIPADPSTPANAIPPRGANPTPNVVIPPSPIVLPIPGIKPNLPIAKNPAPKKVEQFYLNIPPVTTIQKGQPVNQSSWKLFETVTNKQLQSGNKKEVKDATNFITKELPFLSKYIVPGKQPPPPPPPKPSPTPFQNFVKAATSPPPSPPKSPPPSPPKAAASNNSKSSKSCGKKDPLAQSFYVPPGPGIFVTQVDLFFRTKDSLLPVTIQLRPLKNGVPTEDVYPFSEVVVDPAFIALSDDGLAETTVSFQSPVYLQGDSEHAIVILSESHEYTVWISRMGEFDISTSSGPESRQIVVSSQPDLGSLFKSQNGSTWDPSQYEDLKFTLYSALFTSLQGTVSFYNPELSRGNSQIARLLKNSLDFHSRTLNITLNDQINVSDLTLGNTVIQTGTNATANYVGAGGSATGTLKIINAGIGYTPSNGTSYTFNNVALVPLTGNGKNATANITIGTVNSNQGVALAATISSGGSGYRVGDVFTVSQIGSQTLGRNLQLSLSSVNGVNELILDQVQGEFEINPSKNIQYINNVGIATSVKSVTGLNVYASNIVLDNSASDGLHIKVNHKNHGMHSIVNKVELSNIRSEIKATKLNANYSITSSESIGVASTENLGTFENIGISSSNPGFIKIENEIIAYTGLSNGQLTGITRGIDQTTPYTYSSGTIVNKYELNGISLRRINKVHDFQDVNILNPIGLDYYYIKINTAQNGVDRSVGITYPKLYINETKSCGGSSSNATQNIQFEVARPIVQSMILPQTSLTASVRTITGTSVDGTESSFTPLDIESLNLTTNNYFTSPRLIASKINEDAQLSNLSGNKSLELTFTMSTANQALSPVIDLDRVGLILISNRVNNVIEDYALDGRIASLDEDPSAFVYANKPISLETPATSIKVLLAAHVNLSNDIRMFYAVSNNLDSKLIYYPFPGYDNLDVKGTVIDVSKNNGRPNKKVPKSDRKAFLSSDINFKDYEFTVDNLPEFRYFGIKIVGTSTNQAYPPRIKDLRIIALA